MTTDPLLMLVEFACWATAMFALYTFVLLGLDALAAAWQRRRQARRQRRDALARISRDASDTIQRIGTAFVVTQQLIRDEAAASRERRR